MCIFIANLEGVYGFAIVGLQPRFQIVLKFTYTLIHKFTNKQFNSQIHLLIFRCPPEFVYLYREFGGSLWIRDSRQRLATEISDRAPALALMKQLQGKVVDCLFLLYSLTSPVEAIWIWVGPIFINTFL